MSAVPNARPGSKQPGGVAGPSQPQPAAAAAAAAGPPANVQEFVIRVPKNLKKHHHVMRFNATLNVDFAQWKMVKLERENNLKEFRGFDEDMPKFGAGSEYNRELREEVRRKKYGIVAKRYKPEAQPWILKVGGKSGKKFRGIREGGVGENAAFYVFAHAPDGAIEAYPLNEWYNFQPIQRYKALSAEEAEHEFGRRKKVMNFFSLMMRKRLKNDEDEVVDPEEAKANKLAAKRSKELKISDMDEWIDSDEESSDDDDDDEEAKEKRRKKKDEEDSDDGAAAAAKKKGKAPEKKKKKRDPDDEAFEESDDGDEEGRELDYISDSSDSEPDPESKAGKEMGSVAEEDALRKLLTSDEDSDEEKKSGDSDKDADDAKQRKNDAKEAAREAKLANGKKQKKLKKKAAADEAGRKETSSELSSNSSDSDDSSTGGNGAAAPAAKAKGKKAAAAKNKDESRAAGSPAVDAASSSAKRKVTSMPSDLGASSDQASSNPASSSLTAAPAAKRARPEQSATSFGGPATSASSMGALLPAMGGSSSSSSSGRSDENGITEDAVRRYLMRKPMTTTELLTKFKNKKTGVSSEKLVETMTQILKKINPVKQMIQGKMYLSIKTK